MFELLLMAAMLAFVSGCQTMREKNQALVRDRVVKLESLNSGLSHHCLLDMHLTEPVKTRYRNLFPADAKLDDASTWTYTWSANSGHCDIEGNNDEAAQENAAGFLETALCLLYQVYGVNSPFKGLTASPDEVTRAGDQVEIRTGDDPHLGIFLDTHRFRVQTRTKAQGVLTAAYAADRDSFWRPKTLEQQDGATHFLVDQIQYDKGELSSFWISVGTTDLLPFSRVVVHDCE